MRRILVALDGSSFAEQAIGPARRLAERQGAELHIAAVVEDAPSPFLAVDALELSGRWIESERLRVSDYLNEMTDRLAGKGSKVPIESHLSQGSAARTLTEIAGEVDADLLVLTTHGRGGLDRIWLGSTADRLLRIAGVPLLLLPATDGDESRFAESDHPRHILVPLDGSEAAEAILPALDLVRPATGSLVTLVSVLHHPVPFPAVHFPDSLADQATLGEEKKGLQEYLDKVQSRLETRSEGTVATRIIEDADVAGSLVDLCSSEEIDLIALTTHGRGMMGRTFLGSVADKVIRGAGLPVLALRRSD